MFLNSGSEAIDGALKLARRVTGRPGIVAFRGGFHGRTWGATSVTTSNINYRTGYDPMLPGVVFAPYPNAYADFDGDDEAATSACLAILRSLFTTVMAPSSVASILIEPVQGEGGFVPAPPAFLRGLREICDEHGILLIVDEVQSGYGRTGTMWAFEQAGIVPDVVVAREVDRQRPAAIGHRVVARAAGALGSRRPWLDVCRQSGRLRRRAGGPRDDPRGAPARERGRAWRRAACRHGAHRRRGRAHRRRPRAGPDDRRRVRPRPGHARAGRHRCRIA